MSCPCLPRPSCPSYSSISSHESALNKTKPDSSSTSPLNSFSMAPQDCSSKSELTCSSQSQNFPSQPEYSPTTSYRNSSLRSQGACSPILPENFPSTHDYAHSTLIPTYSSKSQMEYSSSSLLNGTSTLLTFSQSLPPMNNSSISQPASSVSSKSPVNCSCQTENSSMCQKTYSYPSLQTCKSISEQTKTDCSFMAEMNGACTSRTDDPSISHLDFSSAYIVPKNEDPGDFLPMPNGSILSLHGGSPTMALNCKPVNHHDKTTQEGQDKALSDECSLVSSISPVDIPCICTCEFTNDFPHGISSSCLSDHECPYTLQSQNYLNLSNTITPINGTTSPQVNATIHPSIKYTSTDHKSTNFNPLTPWSTQCFQSPQFSETDVVSTNDEQSVGDLLVNGHYISHLPSKSTRSCSLSNSISFSPSSGTPPVPESTCPNSVDHAVFTNAHDKQPNMLLSCSHAPPFAAIPTYVTFPEEENQVQECEVCKASLENKVRMDQDSQLCEHFLVCLTRFEDWLQIVQITTSQGNQYKTLHQEAKLAMRKYEVLLTEMREKLLDLESLNRQYWRLAQTPQQTLLPSVLRSRMQEVNMLWDNVQGEAETLHRILKSKVQKREEFETDQDEMKLCLTEMDLELSNVEYIYGGNSSEKIQQLKAFQEDVWSNMKRVEGLLERGDQLIDNSDPRDAADLEVEMTELGSYCQQIYIRLSRLQKRLVSSKLVFEDDFLDSAIEHLSSGSSDVFLDLNFEDGEASSSVNVPLTNAALPIDLEWDPLGDVGRSSSHDGQESFYTATSAPWKLLQRSDGSQSSLSSYSGITYSNMIRQEVKDTVENIHTNHSPSRDTCHLEWTQEQMQSRKSTLVPHNYPLLRETSRDIISCPVSLPIDEPDAEHKISSHFPFSGYTRTTSDRESMSKEQMIDNRSQPNCSGQTRRQRKKKRMIRNQDAKRTLRTTTSDVSILMENGDDLHKTSYRPSCSLCLWIRRLAFVSVLLLVLGTSLLFPWGRQTCQSNRFSWSLMLTYVNGPPPT